MSREAFHNLLKRYLEGNCNAAERRTVEQWYGMLDDEDLQEIKGAELAAIDEKIWNSINSRINKPAMEQDHSESETRVRPLWIKLTVAASVVGVLMTGIYIFNTVNKTQPQFLTEVVSETIVRTNETNNPLVVALEDGSSITLQPNAQIKYPKQFTPNRREVFLQGEAFFEVAKNASRPFYVFSHDLITEVVGTSFTVKTGDQTRESEVAVRTGKVRVSKNESDDAFYKDFIPVGKKKVILTPNQRVVYQPQTHDLIVTLVERPLPVITESKQQDKSDFIFNETPMSEVLNQLEKAYEIKITPDSKDIYKCTFTGDLKDQDMYTRLDFICQAIGAKYKVDGTEIQIFGANCN